MISYSTGFHTAATAIRSLLIFFPSLFSLHISSFLLYSSLLFFVFVSFLACTVAIYGFKQIAIFFCVCEYLYASALFLLNSLLSVYLNTVSIVRTIVIKTFFSMIITVTHTNKNSSTTVAIMNLGSVFIVVDFGASL